MEQTGSCQRRGRGEDRMTEDEGVGQRSHAQKSRTQTSVVVASEKGSGGCVEVGKAGGSGDICIRVHD